MDYTIEEKAMFMREALKEAEIASPMMKYRLAVSWSRMVRLSSKVIMRASWLIKDFIMTFIRVNFLKSGRSLKGLLNYLITARI